MTGERPAPSVQPRRSDAARQRLDRLVRGARGAMLWESAWPALWWPLAVVLLFLVLSWLGLWLDLPPRWRMGGVALFAVALAASFWPLARIRPAGRDRALDRLDRDAGPNHRPARSVEDSLAMGSSDPGSRALWALHQRRAEAAVHRLGVAPPSPGMVRRDPFAIRAAALVATAAAAFVAGPEIGQRLGAAFQWSGAAAAGPVFRVDGWIDPPLYTRLPPLMLDLAAGEQRLKAPVNSTLVVRVAGQGDAQLSPGSGLSELKAPEGAATKPDLREQRFKLTGSGELGIRTGITGAKRIVIDAIPDRAPEIALTQPPETNARGTFDLSYKVTDDYGVTLAEGLVEKPDAGNRRALVPAPRFPLTLPADTRSGEVAKTSVDLTTHPWAGARVRLTLVARDEAEQEGRSAPVEFTLPQRAFTKPLARALVEQRRNLVLDPDRHAPVQLALDSLLIAPERYTPEWGVFLGLRVAADRLRAARGDADLTDVADWLWEMALQIEDGDLSGAERELRAAQERLREAMERGAGDEEIRKLTEDLRTAMDKFLREFAERMQNAPEADRQAQRGQERTISQDDLNRMLNEMQDAMKRGDTAEAQRLLEQLKSILDNLRTAKPGSRMSDPMAREMNRQMDELDQMSRDQQALRDETYRENQQRGQGRNGQRQQRQQGQRDGQRQPGQQGQRGQRGQGPQGQQGQQGEGQGQEGEQAEGQGEGQEGGDGTGLGRRQQALRERLQQLQRRMRGLGMQGEQGLADAEGAMRDAEGQLGQGSGGSAVDSQGRALEGLQRGMQGMAQQMQQMMGQNDGQDQGGEPGGPGNPQGRAQNDPRSDDPLGRPTRSREMSDGRVRIPGANEAGVERARRILEELRRKLGDPNRAQEELDYFERLLKRN